MYDSSEYFTGILLDSEGRPRCVTCKELLHVDGVNRTITHSHTPSGTDALAIVREWVEKEVDDYRDPVIDPGLHDALRVVVGLPPYSRDD